MFNINRRQPGYTLLELLISIAIFAGVMVLALGAFARSANSSAKANLVREKSEAARSVIDQISNDFRYVSEDSKPTGCTVVAFCVDPSGMTASPNKVAMLLKYPGQTNYVMKTYYITNNPLNLTLRVIENRNCSVSSTHVLSCVAPSDNALLLDTKYWLDDVTVFTPKPPTAPGIDYLNVKLILRPRTAANCLNLGTCYKLETTLVPGGF